MRGEMTEELDFAVKMAIYRAIAESGSAPTSGDIAAATRLSEPEVRAAFGRLHAKRLLVPEPGDPGGIRMAPPFSGVPTAFPVDARGRRYYANCVWDAYGIPAALHTDATIPASDGETGERLELRVRGGAPVPGPYLAHFAVPAALWWKDIVYT